MVGWRAAFGAGALVSAVAFDLTQQATALGNSGVTLWMLAGAGVFIGGDYAVDRQIGPSGAEGGALGIVLGAAVRRHLAPSAELAAAGWSRSRLTMMWGTLVLTCGVAAAPGFAAGAVGHTGDRMAALAAGGVLCMLTNSLVPFAYAKGGRLAGLWTVVGFALAIVPR